MELNITSGFYESNSLPISHQQCANWYVNVPQTKGALSKESLFGTPGISQLTTTGTVRQVNRGSKVKSSEVYFVNGDALYRLDRTVVSGSEVFSYIELGTVEGSGFVSLATNGTQLMILVPGGKGYIYNEDAGTPFLEITDSDFIANGNPQYVVFIDGYFLVTTDSKKFIVSALNDGLSWNALDFGTAESDPDAVVAPIVTNNQALITGTQTTEGFQDTGGSGFPFTRNGVFLEKGCLAPFTLIKSNKTFYMVGAGQDESPAIWRYTGNDYQKVSTTAIDTILGGYTSDELTESFAFSYAQNGAYFVGFTFPDRSFVLDQITNRWHERKSTSDEDQIRWRVNSLVTLNSRVIVFDNVDGRVGELSLDEYQEYGEDIIRVVSTQPFANEGNEVRVPILELTMEAGVGNDLRPDPVVGLAISKDSKTFAYERIRHIGLIGEYGRRTIWRKNGRYPRWVTFQFRLSDPVKPVIIKLEAK